MPVASTTEPCPKLHRVVVVVHFDRAGAAAALARRRYLMKEAVSRAPIDVADLAAFADRILSITPLAFVVEVVPDLENTAFPAKPATRCRIVFPEVPPHRLNCHFIDARSSQTHVGTRNCFTKYGNDGLW